MLRKSLLVSLMAVMVLSVPSASGLQPPEVYGNILIDRVTKKNHMAAATFSHWLHRLDYTCRVCHVELQFEMERNKTEITQEALKDGEYCGACHDGEIAFGMEEATCKLCHNGELNYSWNKFDKVTWMEERPHGNGVDWSAAVETGYLEPFNSLYVDEVVKEVRFSKGLKLDSELDLIPSSKFSHESHKRWLDCANCHPDIFATRRGKSRNLTKKMINEGRACGACHGKVAFPINDCEQCHQGIGRKF